MKNTKFSYTIIGRPNSTTSHAIVLDLDETLVHTMAEGSEALHSEVLNSSKQLEVRGRLYNFNLDDTFNSKGMGIRGYYWGLKRPHLNLFLAFCFSYFRYLIIWSAGQQNYVDAVVKVLFEGIGVPDIVYSFNNCVLTKDGYHKPLSVLLSDPRLEGKLEASKVFFIDDRTENFIEHGSNAIIIPKYSPSTLTQMATDDLTLLQLRQWFLQDHVVGARDVRKLDKSKIFVQPLTLPILPSNIGILSWDIMPSLISVTSAPKYNMDRYFQSMENSRITA